MKGIRINKSYTNVSVLNLTLIFFTVFICPLFPSAYLPVLYPACFSGVFFLVALSIEKNRKYNLAASFVLVLLIWTGLIIEIPGLRSFTRILEFFFFIYLLTRMLSEIALSSKVNIQVIIDSITGYFLLGLAYSTMVMFIALQVPGSYNVVYKDLLENYEPLTNFFYYAFVTYTTTGYGDIVPLKPASKSLAILIGVSGQLYIALIISMLIGKFASRHKD
jgi:voltage-gated potassium channel